MKKTTNAAKALLRRMRKRGIRGATTRKGAREHVASMVMSSPGSKSDSYLKFHDRKFGMDEAYSIATLQALPLHALRSLHQGALKGGESEVAKRLRDVMRYKRGINESKKTAKTRYRKAVAQHLGSMQDKLKKANEYAKWKPMVNPFTKPFDIDKKEVKESHNVETLERMSLGRLRKLHKEYMAKGTKEARREASTIMRIMRSRQLSEGSIFSFREFHAQG